MRDGRYEIGVDFHLGATSARMGMPNWVDDALLGDAADKFLPEILSNPLDAWELMAAAAVLAIEWGLTAEGRALHLYLGERILDMISDRVADCDDWFPEACRISREMRCGTRQLEGEEQFVRQTCQYRMSQAGSPPSAVDLIAGAAYHLALMAEHHGRHPREVVRFARGLVEYACLAQAAGLTGTARRSAMSVASMEFADRLRDVLRFVSADGSNTGAATPEPEVTGERLAYEQAVEGYSHEIGNPDSGTTAVNSSLAATEAVEAPER